MTRRKRTKQPKPEPEAKPRQIITEGLLTAEMDRNAIRERMASGTYSLMDLIVAKAFGGNERLLVELLRAAREDRNDDEDEAAATLARQIWEAEAEGE